MVQLKNKICLIGGNGEVVSEAAKYLDKTNNLKNIILLENNANLDKKFFNITYKFSIKNFKDIIKKLNQLKINKIMIIGYVNFPKFNQINFDLQTKLFLTKKFFLNNESKQTQILKDLLSYKKIKLLSPLKYLEDLIINENDQIIFKKFDHYKIKSLGCINNIKKLSSVNIGQSIIINGNRILALENFKGTDAMINLFINNKFYNELIFIKFKKSNQINEIDFPIIGLNTIKNLIRIKIKAIILFKNQTLIVNKIECMKMIKKHQINLIII